MGLIYKIQNNINNKVYVGQTKGPLKNRIRSHKGLVKRGTFSIYRAMRKHRYENFSFLEIEIDIEENNLNDRECYWINFFDSYKNGYNDHPGGSWTNEEYLLWMEKIRPTKNKGYVFPKRVFSEEWKQNMRKPHQLTDEQRLFYSKRMIDMFKGKKLSENHKKLISKSNMKKIKQFDLNGNFIKEWESIQSACLFYKTSPANLTGALKGHQKTAVKYKWEYSNDN